MITNLPTEGLYFILLTFNAILSKGKDITQISTHHPISFQPILSKVFVKIWHMDASVIVPDHQFGFRRKHSAIQQVQRITNLMHFWEQA